MKKMNLNELDCFITVYFGQDYDLIDNSDEIEPKIDAFIADSHFAMRHGLIADIDLLLAESDDPEAEFNTRYGFEFDPKLWGTDAVSFLMQVRERVSRTIKK